MAENAATVYSGQDFSPRGEKGRYVLPPEFRKAVDRIERRQGPVPRQARALEVPDRLRPVARARARRPALPRGRARDPRSAATSTSTCAAIQLFGFKKISFDDSGRFIVPEHLAGLAGLTGDVFFQGAGSFFTLWNPDELYRMGEGWESAQAACRALAEEAGKKRKG